MSHGSIDEVDANVEVIALEPEEVTISVLGWQERIDTIYAFMLFCQSRWPCDVMEQQHRVITAEDYRDRQRATYHPPQIVE